MSEVNEELRDLAREEPDAVQRVAEKAGGRIEKRLKQLIKEEWDKWP